MLLLPLLSNYHTTVLLNTLLRIFSSLGVAELITQLLILANILWLPLCRHYCRLLLTRHYNQRPFNETVCDALIANGGVKKPSKKVQNVCDDGCIKHGSGFSCVCDEGQTVQFNELLAMRRNKRNGLPDEGVCDIQHRVHWDELCVIWQHNGNGSTEQDVCDTRQTGP